MVIRKGKDESHVDVGLLGEDLRSLRKPACGIVLHEIRGEGVNPLRGHRLGQHDEKVIAAVAVAVEQERMEPSLLQFCKPRECRFGVCRGDGGMVSVAMLVDIDDEPPARAIGRNRVQPDQRALIVAAVVIFDDLGGKSPWRRRALLGAV